MEEIVKEFIKSSPSLGLCAFLVVVFLRYLGRRDDLLQKISEQSNEVNKISQEIIRENSRALGQAAEVISQAVQHMKEDPRSQGLRSQ